mmetsp:Transcript_56955/g.144495  ORF Transcript_56955/g.144495 Transcript_56955/m.144495 type:complete len:101 (+) Transcript_56955:71-373(+)
MKAWSALLCGLAMQLLLSAPRSVEACDYQEIFDTVMCKSHMCTECTLYWCQGACQKVQERHPGCRCEDWPDSRTSFSEGEFEGKGKYGDVGEYGTGSSTE